jgi:tRNA(Ile)-lysidine synthase
MSDPLGAAEFAELMARCGPFEPRPLLAVAVSGGADSLALTLLAHEWARPRKGRVLALTVDHALRRASRAEARTVARWMKRCGIVHQILAWRGAKPKTGVQEAARAARYRLLGDACRREGALHLLLAHTGDDQAETVLLRLAAGSGPHGLAGMAPVQDGADYRIVRPLLGVARARLRAALEAREQGWIEDPSNRDERFARIGVRRMLAADGAADRPAQLADAASELGRFRAGQERAIADALARAIRLHPEGYAELDAGALAAASPEIGWRALGALLATIGGLPYAPHGEPLRRLHADLCAGRIGKGRTLARCRLIPGGATCLVVRESRGVETVTLPAGAKGVTAWDGRFACALAARRSDVELGPLGVDGWAAMARAPGLGAPAIPYAARLGLPALRDRRGILAVPALGYHRAGSPKKTLIAAFQPLRPLAPAIFAAPLLP